MALRFTFPDTSRLLAFSLLTWDSAISARSSASSNSSLACSSCELLDAPLALAHALDVLHVALLLRLQLVLQLSHPGLQLLELLLASLEGQLLSLVQPQLQVLDGLLHVLLHALQVTFHLLLDPQCLVAAVVPFGLFHLLIFLNQLALNVGLDLVEFQLRPKDLPFLMFQGALERQRWRG
uniref:Uncharacterized protein n=1 Tax=Salvator merianae TaxID=96440 RepID=A0A8D0B4Z0_SALMN